MKYDATVSRSARKSEVQKMELTWAGELHQRGLREGVVIGQREAIETARRLPAMILTQRFGTEAEGLVERLERLEDPARIEAISRRALQSASLAEVEGSIDA